MSSLLTLEQQQKDFLKFTSIRIFLFISYSFGIKTVNTFIHSWAELFKAGLRLPSVSARFEFRFESLKSISVLILFVYKLMIGSFKNNRDNYPRKCLWTQEKETRVKFNTGLSTYRPSNNWALLFVRKPYPIPDQNGQSLYPFSNQNGSKPCPLGRHKTTVKFRK